MIVVIDTSVLVSAAFRDRTPEEVILFVTGQDAFHWIVSDEILAEYREVLSRPKFGLSVEILDQWIEILESSTIEIDVDLEIDFPRDRKDAKFIACALAAQANFFITGDHDFSEAQQMMSTTIISVSLFKRTVCDNWR
ncbi:MAG: putative toxin-antitoxin system toxin component, PIN family [Gemmatimonadota bacterium]|nr:putative toxin-antitoxin system toxin component, PIN family [Gemmatimonadota bacterium]MDE2954763.1 putative toxin-antitoxin system toxin component, PIN family [Gemmatimonadota bacterium]